MKQGQFPAVFNLTDLNGQNGFILDGSGTEDSGYSVSRAGDINGDGYNDLLVGAPFSFPSCRIYVVFGNPEIGSLNNGLISMVKLNGTNGFIINGELNDDRCGAAVSAAGDVNGDGVADILIGAYGYNQQNQQTGRSYVVFGGSGIGNKGILNLGSLNGLNGFKLDGENNNDWSGVSVGGAGDFNGDTYADLLIGSTRHNNGKGRTYLVFGGNSSVNNGGLFNLSSLNGTNGFKFDGERTASEFAWSVSTAGDINGDGRIDLIISDVLGGIGSDGRSYVVFDGAAIGANGTLSLGSLNGTNGFKLDGESTYGYSGNCVGAAGDVNADGLSDIIIGAYGHNGHIYSPGRSYVIFGDVVPQLWVNQLNFTIINSQHGQWKLLPANQSVSEFTQQQLLAGQVMIVQDDSNQAPAFAVGVNDPYFTLSPLTPDITFYHRPVLVNNQLTIIEHGTTVLSKNSLSVTDDYLPDQVWFQINEVQHGQFEWLPSNLSITRFTQQQVNAGQIQLRHDNSELSPQYNVSVSDPFFAIGPFPGQVTFIPIYDDIPVFLNNRLTTLQGRTSVLSAADLSALDINPQVDQSTLLFTVSQVQHGFFNQIQNPAVPVTQFTQEQIGSHQIAFTQDGAGFTPAYNVMVSDGVLSSEMQAANITFYAAPTIIVNQLAIALGETVVFSRANLHAIPNAYTTEAELVFTANDIEHGYFSMIESPNVSVIQFTQNAVTNSEIEFTQDGSDQIPAYTLMVTDPNGLTAGPSVARVTLSTPSALNATPNTVRNAIIGAVISGVVGFGFFACQLWVKRKAESYLERTAEEKDGVGKEQADYYKNVLRPMAKKILSRIKLTGFLNYISENTLKDALNAVTILVHELEKQGVEVDLSKLRPIERNRLLDTVARKTRQILVPEVSCCSSAQFARLFCPEVTPMQIEENAVVIAQAVKTALDSSVPISRSSSTPMLELQSPTQMRESKQLLKTPAEMEDKSNTLLIPHDNLSSSYRVDLSQNSGSVSMADAPATPTSKNRNSFVGNVNSRKISEEHSQNQQSHTV